MRRVDWTRRQERGVKSEVFRGPAWAALPPEAQRLYLVSVFEANERGAFTRAAVARGERAAVYCPEQHRTTWGRPGSHPPDSDPGRHVASPSDRD